MKIDAEVELMKLKVQANSPYNDGWTRELYQNLYEKELKKLEKRKNKNNGKIRLQKHS